ncbi:MAG: cytochrome-c peroxidase [Bacteroidia bacterium]
MNRISFLILFTVVVCVGFVAQQATTPYVFPALRFFPPMPVSAENPVSNEGAMLGRYLFYDPVLSRDSSISCASCHKQEFAFTDGAKKFSTGIDGQAMKRNTMPLFNLAWYSTFFWDGRATSIETQVFQPVTAHDEMDLDWNLAAIRISRNPFYKKQFATVFANQKIDSVLIAYAIAQFERTLISSRSKYDEMSLRKAFFTDNEAKGFVIANDMTKGDCLHCHTTDGNALGTTGKFSNNGLDKILPLDGGLGAISGKQNEWGQFKIPSLRNVALTAPYMHDGRFATLREVIDFYSEGVHTGNTVDSKMTAAKNGGVHLTEIEKEQLLAFLFTLTDSAFIRDERYSNPWK